jgi:hypothetical protein
MSRILIASNSYFGSRTELFSKFLCSAGKQFSNWNGVRLNGRDREPFRDFGAKNGM